MRGWQNEWVLCRVFKKSLVGLVPPPAAAAKKGAGEMAKTDDMVLAHHLPPLMDMSGVATVNPAAAHVTCFSNALEGQFFNNTVPHPQLALAAANGTDHLGLASSSSPFFAQYGQLQQGMSLVQLLESNGYAGLADDAGGKQRERERLSASQDTGLTSDVNPEISSGQKFDQDQLWGY
jgi:hypothetical protein